MVLLLLLPLLMVVYTTSVGATDECGCCPDLETEDYPFTEVTQHNSYRIFTTNTSIYVGVDNICYSYLNLPSGDYLVYESFVYSNGSTEVKNNILSPETCGTGLLSGSEFIQRQYFLGNTSCGTYVGYECDECGQENQRYGTGISSRYGRISNRCFAEAASILSDQNLYCGKLYILPMKLPPQCYSPPCC